MGQRQSEPSDHLNRWWLTLRMKETESLSPSDLKADNRVRADTKSPEHINSTDISPFWQTYVEYRKKQALHSQSTSSQFFQLWSSIPRHLFLRHNMHGKEKAFSANPSVLVMRRHPFSLSAPVGDQSLCLHLLPSCRVRQSASEEEGRRSTKDRCVVITSVWDTSSLVHTNIEKYTHAHARTPSTVELKTFHPNLPQNIALNNGKTRAAEQSTNEQKKIPESESSVCCCEFSAFLDHRVWAFSQAASKHTHSSARTHTHRKTHAERTPKNATASHSAKLRYSERVAAQSDLKNLLVSPPL